MSDTPIFDQLARERGYNRMVAGGPTPPLRARKLYTHPQIVVDQMEAHGAQTDESVNAAPTEEDEVIVFRKPIPVTTLAELAEGTHQE
jgi:hypothetical protein